ncbi:MAG: methionyl-tRNA formyltransferase [Bacteroidales bacterium]|jgi:methionyl-tRNA formyltransferase|nr:methionyl-tRNA formyltransferase [Bacteroidales bacterium]
MKIVFMGTPDFATAILETIVLSQRHEIAAVVTAVDKPGGRGMQLMQSSVKQFALKHHLPILQPEKLKDTSFIHSLESIQADVFVVVAFRMLPEVVWKIPPKGTINLHASLLPQYRGAAPINWAIIHGESETGLTTFFINEKIDEGNIILAHSVDIDEKDNAGSLHDKLMHVGGEIILDTLEQIENNTYKEKKQASFIYLKTAPKIFKKDCLIDWKQTPQKIHNFIRGLSPYPTAFTSYMDDNNRLISFKVYASKFEITIHNLPCGMIQSDGKEYVRVACKQGFIYIEEIQLDGKKRMPIKDFLLGNKTLHMKQCR